MGSPSKQLRKFMETYGVDSDEIWEVRAGGAWAIKHSAIERVAAEKNITFDQPCMIETNSAQKIVSMCVTGKMGERTEWSIGEASPSNYRTTDKMAAYPYAIAEKRAKDRVVLKLLHAHGAVYSESEADDFAPKRQNPHVTRPEDIAEPVEVDEHGHPIDNIPLGDDTIERMPKAKARQDWEACQNEIRNCPTPHECERWGKANANRVASFPGDWQEILRGVFREHKNSLTTPLRAAG